MRDDFAVFILSHGRANKILTLETLKKCGYTGKTYIVIDDEDDSEDEYRRLYGDMVVQFNKKEWAEKTDFADNFIDDRRSVVFARNFSFQLAKDLGLKYFCELDDDYTSFLHRYIEGDKLKSTSCKNIDLIFDAMIDFLNDSGAITVCMAQGGDFIGGADSGTFKKGLLRKAMNSFVCDVDKAFEFYGRINEDVNAYVVHGIRGKLLFTLTHVQLCQLQTQSNAGGWTEVYLEKGTYVKSFYSVIYAPSCVYVRAMGDKHLRIHHAIKWNNCCPKIINQKYKKVTT